MSNDLYQQMASVFSSSLKDRIKKKADEAGKVAFKKAFEFVSPTYEKMWRDAVKEWYGGYKQKFYNRTYAVYDVYEFSVDDSFISHRAYDDRMNEYERSSSQTHGLFYQVVQNGWHGGAPNEDQGNALFYRTPQPKDESSKGYWRWGRSATRGITESPWNLFVKKAQEFESTELSKIVQDFYNQEVGKITLF